MRARSPKGGAGAPTIRVVDLARDYRRGPRSVHALRGVSLDVQAGEFVSILGHSGCGKSTVLAMVAGLDHSTLGGVLVDGTEVRTPGAERAVVFQAPCLLPWLTAEDNVALAATQGTTPRSRR